MDECIQRMADRLIASARVFDLVEQSDYDFYTKMCRDMSDEEYEEFCKGFPEARVIDRSAGKCKQDE